MKPLFISILTALVLFEHPILAGNEGGAGGDGVLLGNDLYLIDLVEAGIEADPFIDASVETDPLYQAVVKRLETPLAVLKAPEVIRAVAMKLVEISKISTPLALTLLQTIGNYRWVLVNHALVDVADDDSVLELGTGTLTQLAIRRLHSVFVSRDSWQKLNTLHRAALIVHEATFANVNPSVGGKKIDGNVVKYQSSPKARELVGVVFSQDKKQLRHLLRGFGDLGSADYFTFAENIYETFSSDGRAESWQKPGDLTVAISDRPEGWNGDTYYGKLHPFLSVTTAQGICEEVLELSKIYTTKFPRDDTKVYVFFKHDAVGHSGYWETFLNERLEASQYQSWSEVFTNGTIHDFPLKGHKGYWDRTKCEQDIETALAQYRKNFVSPNVFWKSRTEEGKQ